MVRIVSVTKEGFKFSATHFLIEYPGDCARLHGHNWMVGVTVEGPLNEMGMVIDFRILKEICDPIFSELDHRLLVPKNDQVTMVEGDKRPNIRITFSDVKICFPKKWVRVVPIINMTSELLSEYLAKRIFDALKDHQEGKNTTRVQIDLYETNTSKAVCST